MPILPAMAAAGPPDPHAARYEQCVRVSSVFFSALMGFGLKKIADASWPDSQKWACFAVAYFLFLRLLFGTANHMWLEYVADPPATRKMGGSLFWDIGGLVVSACAGLWMCYANDAGDFLWRAFQFSLVGLGIVAADFCFRRKTGGVERGFSKGWVWIEAAFFILIGALLAIRHFFPGSYLKGDEALWLLVPAAVLFFAEDLMHQLNRIHAARRILPAQKLKTYEPGVRVFTVFFSMLTGFGLKYLADGPDTWSQMESWCAFVIALLLFLRFLFGSANYLSVEYIRHHDSDGRKRALMVWDSISLSLVGWVAVMMCYSPNFHHFLMMSAGFTGLALLLTLGDLGARKLSGLTERRGFWLVWVGCDFVFTAAAVALVYFREQKLAISISGFALTGELLLFAFLLLSLALFVIELLGQLAAIEKG
ncbi:hypothetical protein [Luteolibacter luteus]|uniref:Uncharacterized protein n=1 Tax=Luteolibacter luteus TaxID=2728835 RepID=A0A858RRC9_9BACT|nr:hypothetical protein [Luteolibacter luteus]QJE98889.1 hypothetical protein HHL09_24945 [Luteolibacter luteus]